MKQQPPRIRTFKERKKANSGVVIRAVGAVAFLLLLLVTISDFFTDFWTGHAMVTANVSALLVLVVGGAVVNEYLSARSRRQWQTVAALAVTQLRDDTRVITVRLAAAVGKGDRSETRTDQVRAGIAADPDCMRAAAISALGESDERDGICRAASGVLDHSQLLAREWAAVMVNEPAYAGLLDAFVDILNRTWRIAWALSPAERGDRPAPPDAAIATELNDIIIDALTLEDDLTEAVRQLLPWPDSFGPAPSC